MSDISTWASDEHLVTMAIGTSVACGVRVTGDLYVSSLHASVTRQPDGTVWIEDLGSMNGTYVERIGIRFRVWGPFQIFPGDTIWLGHRTSIPWRKEPA